MPSDGHAPHIHPSLPDGVTRGRFGEVEFTSTGGTRFALCANGHGLTLTVAADAYEAYEPLTCDEASRIKAMVDDVIAFGTYDPTTGRYAQVCK